MNVLLLSAYHTSHNGGAAVAAYRLHKGLQSIGIASNMLVQNNSDNDPAILELPGRTAKLAARFRLPLRLDTRWLLRFFTSKQPGPAWDIGWLPSAVPAQVNRLNPDVVHLHWIGHGFMPIRSLAKLKRPLVWTFHDSWAFTGGCHLPHNCVRYREECGACPQLGSSHNRDLSNWIWKQKKKHWQKLQLVAVAPSHWMADCIKTSSLFQNVRVVVIPYGLDLTRYQPLDKTLARVALGLPQGKKLILFGAVRSTSDPNKGFEQLQSALQQLKTEDWGEKAALAIFGSSGADAPDLGLDTHYLGYFNDEVSLALVYSAADVFVAPSIQDNLPNTVLEALACGTPCVAFNIGGMPDMIEHQRTGYLARPYETIDLANGISWVLNDDERWNILSHQARQKAENEFDLDVIAKRYVALYQGLVEEI